MRIPPYLPVSRLAPGMIQRPAEPFFLRPRDYRVVDGDTFMVLAPPAEPGARREEAFRIRLYSVDTPEKPLRRGSEESLRCAGIDPHADSPGRQASLLVKALCKGRALYIEPETNRNGQFTDRYGRLLANVCLSGSPGQDFDTEGAYTLGPALMRRGYASPMKGKEVPPDVPYAIWQLNQAQRDQNAFSPDAGPSF